MDIQWALRQINAYRRRQASAVKKAKFVGKIRKEAAQHEATLARDGEGGLDPELALAVFRRDDYRCCIPGCQTPRDKIDLDHIGGHPREIKEDPQADKWLKAQAKKGKQNTLDGIHVLCLRHHDMVHDRERDIEEGEEPEPILPDEG